MKLHSVLLILILPGFCLAMSMVNDEPKYSTKEYIQSYCILEYCPEHINDDEFKDQKSIPSQVCYKRCCDKHGGCPKTVDD